MSFVDFLENPLDEWEEEFKRLGLTLPDKIVLRNIHKRNASVVVAPSVNVRTSGGCGLKSNNKTLPSTLREMENGAGSNGQKVGYTT